MDKRKPTPDNLPPLILMVDDVPENLQVLGNLLQAENLRIAMATSGEQALEMCADIQPDLILLDIMMPGQDGLETCRRLKAEPTTAQIPVVFLTARSETEDIVQGFQAGAADYVTKPFQSEELKVRVRTQLALKQARDTESRILTEQEELISQLQEALSKVRQLSGLLPICSHCKKIRDDAGYWHRLEVYISSHSEAEFTHSLCADCLWKYYPETAERLEKERQDAAQQSGQTKTKSRDQ